MLGIAAAISPVGFLMDNIVDTLILIIMSSAVLVFAWTSKVINPKEGIAVLCMYAVYMVYIWHAIKLAGKVAKRRTSRIKRLTE